ncbi:hypothetical protein KAU88_02845 [Candidatus Bathyarchaeota archaeon]|nr:hypothetical protein [Candidatus Bathyarchaeota archaeon]
MSCKANYLAERLLKCLEKSEDKADLDTWIDSLEELSEIEDAFEVGIKKKWRRVYRINHLQNIFETVEHSRRLGRYIYEIQ